MFKITKQNIERWSQEGYRNTFGMAIVEIGKTNQDVVVLTADLAGTTRVIKFAENFPDRFFQAGIAEQNLIGMAAGLASCGKIPVVTTFATFASMRCCEQLRSDVAYTGFNVKVIGVDSGISMGTLGATHNAIEDMGIIRSIPNILILSPCDGLELVKAINAAIEQRGPVYVRMGGGKSLKPVYKENYEFNVGKAVTLREGKDGTIIATGTMVSKALEAADILSGDNISLRVINVHTIKPVDEDIIVKAANETKNIITIEEHSVIGGLGSAVADVMAQAGVGTLIKIGLPDAFGPIAPYQELLAYYGLTPEKITVTIKQFFIRGIPCYALK
ncbi:MAG: transketolase family protein [Clostridiales bacterium]|nr:transketolase family protein [Clostridiales bacterium]